MHPVEKAVEKVEKARDAMVRLVDGAAPGGGGVGQTLTVACSAVEAEELWRDPDRLSVLLGDLGSVRHHPPDRYDWDLRRGDVHLHWQSRLVAGPDGLRFTDDNGRQVQVRYRPAPGHLGTEMTLSADLPVPGLLVGSAVFTVLYRARALLQTGEVPTIANAPSGRN